VGTLEAKAFCEFYGTSYVPEYIPPVVPEPIVAPEPSKEVKPMEPLNFEESLQLLKERCGIDPDHWRQANDSVKYIEDLFVKIANAIR